MKIFFDLTDIQAILDHIEGAITEPRIRKMIAIKKEGEQLVLTISRMGKSTLNFSWNQQKSGTTLTLTHEKIALAHRPFKDEVTEDIKAIIVKAGGTIHD